MGNLVKKSALAAILLGSSGCTTWNTLESQARVDPRTVATYQAIVKPTKATAQAQAADGRCEVQRLRGDNYDAPLNLDCFKFPDQTGGDTAYELAAKTNGKGARNRLAAILIKESDDVCVKEMGDISAREAISNTFLGTATSALSTVSSIVTGRRLKSWLSGGATLTNATRDHINAEVYRNVLASAMAKAIDNSRTQQRTELLKRFDLNETSYPVDLMIADVNRYHQSCSFYNGVALVVDAVNRASPASADAYRDLTVGISDLGIEIAAVERRLASAPVADKPKLQAELAGLINDRTRLIKERANLGTKTPASASDSTTGTTTTTTGTTTSQ